MRDGWGLLVDDDLILHVWAPAVADVTNPHGLVRVHAQAPLAGRDVDVVFAELATKIDEHEARPHPHAHPDDALYAIGGGPTEQIRVRGDYFSGYLSNDPLAFDDTTASSAAFAALPEIVEPFHMILTLNPTGGLQAPETIWITDHVAGSEDATIERGKEGTEAQEWAAGTVWSAGTGFSDLIVHCTNATKPTEPFIGMLIDVHDKKRYERWNGTLWIPAWAYAPDGRIGCRLVCDNNQSVPHITDTQIQWNNPTFDPDSFQTSAAVVTIPAGMGGIYAVSAEVRHALNSGNEFLMSISFPDAADGSTSYHFGPQKGTTVFADREAGSVTKALAEGDRVVVSVSQSTGGATEYNGTLEVWRVGG